MPLTNDGKKTLKNFQKEYGKPKGRSVFYSYLNTLTKRQRRIYEG